MIPFNKILDKIHLIFSFPIDTQAFFYPSGTSPSFIHAIRTRNRGELQFYRGRIIRSRSNGYDSSSLRAESRHSGFFNPLDTPINPPPRQRSR